MKREQIHSRIVISCLIVVLAIIIYYFGVIAAQPSEVHAYANKNFVRLHVLANSNSPHDQDLKLTVRDAVLAATNNLFSGVAEKEVAEQLILEHWELIQDTATAAVRAAGYDYDIHLEYDVFPFPDRQYGALVLPAGEYTALRIVIGEGRGDNWWCVLFPPLCFIEPEPEPTADSVISLAPHLEEGDIEIRSRFWERIRNTKAVQRLEEWWVASLEVANHLALPLLKSK
ncbi:MAG: stage II sporulation protein R [Firmicutes bacterium]|jgi:stage II sporulation protein R|nr:stage II sporulation protein R [Bacillota bacterium]